jgi:PAS domain S-box-containing protein
MDRSAPPEELARKIRELESEIALRKRTEKALHASEKKYRDVVANANSIILRWDAAGNILFMNPFGLEFFCFSEEELVGRNVVGTIVAETETTSRRNLVALMQDIQRDPDKYKNNENENIRKDGTRVWISWTNKAVVDTAGNIEEILSIGNDITEKKQLEDRLQRARKMEAIGALAGGVAHDLNNVLSGIVGYPDLLLMQLPPDSPLTEPLLTIRESGKKAASIVQDLLTLARRGVAVSEAASLNTIVRQYLDSPEFMKLQSFHPGVALQTTLAADLQNVLGSPVHIAKTIMNLVSNAAESMSAGGTIFISTANQYIDTPLKGYDHVEEGDYAVLTISDTGTGMPPEDMEHIFEPFYSKKKMGRSGTGLGMAVVWGTVKDHNGYIDFESTPGKGTTFKIYFPVTRQEVAAREQGRLALEKYQGCGESILVVDDMKEQREITSMILSRLGYSVSVAASGEEAIAALQDTAVDLLVLDMIMDTGIDGLETYRLILERHPGQKAVIASGFSETDRVKEALRLGAGQYVRKPYTIEKIGRAIKETLEKTE